MPVRMVDGEGLWGSEKLSKVHPDARSEYANWLPLAEANGVFELDVKKIWSRIYSYNRDETPVSFVEFVIEEFLKTGLLISWKQDGRSYGFWTGINKKGRLPHPMQLKQYKNLPPNPPKELLEKGLEGDSGVSQETPREWVGGTTPNQTIPTPNQNQTANEVNEMALADKLKILIFEKTGKSPRLPDYLVTEFRKRMGSEKEKLASFREYLNSNAYSEYPLHGFLDTEVEAYVAPVVVAGVVRNEEVLSLAAKIYTISDYALSGKGMTAAANLLEKYPEDVILFAFKNFYRKLDDFGQKHAVRQFFEQGAAESIIVSLREQKEKQDEDFRKAESIPVKPLVSAQEAEEEEEQGLSPEDF